MIKEDNPMLLNVRYIRPSRDSDREECFEVIYKTRDGLVHKVEEPPYADIYIVKEKYRNFTYNKPQERIEKMDKKQVPISKIRYQIANEMGEQGRQFIKNCYETRNFGAINQLYKWPYAFGCDFQPEFYYMKNWYEKYDLRDIKLTKAFIDIETDLMVYELDMDNIQNTAYSPVNLISVTFEETKEVHTLILRPSKPSKLGRSEEEYLKIYNMYLKQMEDHQKLMSNMNSFINDLHESFDETYGYLNYNIHEYEKEIDLIANAFKLINDRKPNFCMIWNMRFDIQYLYYRIIQLGYNPASIMCHPDFKDKKCLFKVDRSTYMLEKQYDYFECSSYTQYICQMRLYASIRKSQHKLRSVALNAIGDIELKDKKVEYPPESNIRTFPYNDWIRFIKYNIKDTLIQVGIERKTDDCMTYYMRSHSNLTPYSKIFRETHLLRNVREMYFEKDGWIQGNNINILDTRESEQQKRFYYDDEDDEDESTFKGAINADPIWNDHVGMKVMGSKTNNVFQNSIDYDMGGFYPSCKIASNMDPGTLLYKAEFNNEEFISGEYINRSLNTNYFEKDKNGNTRRLDITGEAVNTYASGNILTFGYNYLGLPSIDDIAKRVFKELCK